MAYQERAEDRFRFPRGDRRLSVIALLEVFLCGGQIDRECRASIALAIHGDVPAALGDDPVHHRKAVARPLCRHLLW